MSSTVRCSCGASLRVAPELQGKTVRCPRCGSSVATTAPPPEPTPAATVAPPDDNTATFAAGEAEAGLSCPICLTTIQQGESVRRCAGCDLVHHQECWAEVGGCGTFGCKEAPAADKSEQSPQAPLTAWGDTKECPVCGETIKSIALVCRYCKAKFDTVDPLTASDLRTQARENERLKSVKQSVIALFVVSLLGCFAPLVALIAVIYVPYNRVQIAKCGPVYSILAWTSLALSCVYSVLLFLFYLVQS